MRISSREKCQRSNFNKDMFAVFQIIILTVPSMYVVVYFALWQNLVTRLDLSLGIIMLHIQGT